MLIVAVLKKKSKWFRFTVFLFLCLVYKLVVTYTVGTYSPGKLSVVYDINMHVLPTVPSPTTTHLMGLPVDICNTKEDMICYVCRQVFVFYLALYTVLYK